MRIPMLCAVLLVAFIHAAASPASDGRSPPAFLERVEAEMVQRGPELRRESLEHYALIHPIEQPDLLRALEPVSFRPDGSAFVLGVGDVVEYHGGGILGLIFAQWRPDGRAASPDDRFLFVPNRRSLALRTIYAGHRDQIFLPVPERSAEKIRGAIPDRPQLARMHFSVPTASGGTRAEERDAYSFLGLLVAREADFGATWVNRMEQRLSVDLLLRNAWQQYLTETSIEAEHADHSRLHLVEILLAYRRRAAEHSGHADDLDPNAIKRRFLSVELPRRGGEVDDEALAHYVESLGWLLADPGVTWNSAESAQFTEWLRQLDEGRFRDLEALDPRYLSHLLKGLRMIRAHASRLPAPGAPVR